MVLAHSSWMYLAMAMWDLPVVLVKYRRQVTPAVAFLAKRACLDKMDWGLRRRGAQRLSHQ
jgi:hypothetical protein